MGYKYEDYRDWVFTDEGQRQFLSIRDRVKVLLKQSGAFTMGAAIRGEIGMNWHHMACVERLVELGEVRCLFNDTAGQFWIYTDIGAEHGYRE